MTSRRRLESKRRDAGFSLSELLTVVALMALMILFAGPAFSEAFKAYKVRSVANEMTLDLRALRYNAVANRTTATMTLNNQSHATAPNQYTFVNSKGTPVTVRLQSGVNLETASAATVSFNNNGSTGVAGNLSAVVSMPINDARGDRYTVSITPSGTVSSAYSTYVP